MISVAEVKRGDDMSSRGIYATADAFMMSSETAHKQNIELCFLFQQPSETEENTR